MHGVHVVGVFLGRHQTLSKEAIFFIDSREGTLEVGDFAEAVVGEPTRITQRTFEAIDIRIARCHIYWKTGHVSPKLIGVYLFNLCTYRCGLVNQAKREIKNDTTTPKACLLRRRRRML